jgi:hypothetical protein
MQKGEELTPEEANAMIAQAQAGVAQQLAQVEKGKGGLSRGLNDVPISAVRWRVFLRLFLFYFF